MPENNENSEREHPEPGDLLDFDPADAPTPEEMGIELDDVPPEYKEEPQPVFDEPDAIIEENYNKVQPDIPDVMSGESIRLHDDGRDWHEPRSLY